MTDKVQSYREGTTPVGNTNRLWPLYGAGLENLGLEYRNVSLFLRGKIKNRNDLYQKLSGDISRFAKRQETWFRREEGIDWWDARKTRECLTSMMEMPAVAGGEPEKIAGIAEPTGAPGGGG